MRVTSKTIDGLYVSWVLRGKTVFVVSGLRRSGNHACINWIANSMMGQPCNPVKVHPKIFLYADGECVHLNEVNFEGARNFVRLLRKARRYVKDAKSVIISLEDELSTPGQIYTPQKAKKIYVKRRILDTMASRITKNIEKAKLGIDRGDMNISPQTFEMHRKLVSLKKDRAFVWEYENWLNDDAWRAGFLHDIGLQFDAVPDISNHGGGSSFVGTNQAEFSKIDRQRIWRELDWPQRVVKLLMENQDLCDDVELAFIDSNFAGSEHHDGERTQARDFKVA